MSSIAEEPRCPNCGGLEMEYRWKHKLWDEKVCAPQNCSNWRVTGKSKNGGPLLRIVQNNASDEGARCTQ